MLFKLLSAETRGVLEDIIVEVSRNVLKIFSINIYIETLLCPIIMLGSLYFISEVLYFVTQALL